MRRETRPYTLYELFVFRKCSYMYIVHVRARAAAPSSTKLEYDLSALSAFTF